MNPEELQAAIYARLNVVGITGLLTASYGVNAIFNEWVPQVTDAGDPSFFPFITMSFPASTPFDDKTAAGANSLVQIDVWSRANTSQVKIIAKAVYDALHRQALGVVGHVATQAEDMVFERDPDGLTRRARLTFRVIAIA
jgi:hypothetical protein